MRTASRINGCRQVTPSGRAAVINRALATAPWMAEGCLVKAGDGRQELGIRLTNNRQGVEDNPGVLGNVSESFLDSRGQRSVFQIKPVRRAFAKLPNKRIQNQQQSIDRPTGWSTVSATNPGNSCARQASATSRGISRFNGKCRIAGVLRRSSQSGSSGSARAVMISASSSCSKESARYLSTDMVSSSAQCTSSTSNTARTGAIARERSAQRIRG